MRVRYKMVGFQPVACCDMGERKARRLFKDLSTKGLCEWAELVGEDDDNYMDILDSFDHSDIARTMYKVMQELGVI